MRAPEVFGQPDVRGRLFVRCSIKMPEGGLLGETDTASRILHTLLPKDGSQGRARARQRAEARSGWPTPPAARGSIAHFGCFGGGGGGDSDSDSEFFF